MTPSSRHCGVRDFDTPRAWETVFGGVTERVGEVETEESVLFVDVV
jgi:hypothetical protein